MSQPPSKQSGGRRGEVCLPVAALLERERLALLGVVADPAPVGSFSREKKVEMLLDIVLRRFVFDEGPSSVDSGVGGAKGLVVQRAFGRCGVQDDCSSGGDFLGLGLPEDPGRVMAPARLK